MYLCHQFATYTTAQLPFRTFSTIQYTPLLLLCTGYINKRKPTHSPRGNIVDGVEMIFAQSFNWKT